MGPDDNSPQPPNPGFFRPPMLPEPPPPGGSNARLTSHVDIRTLLGQVSAQSPVGHIVDSIRNRTYRPLDDVHALFSALAHPGRRVWQEQVLAAWALGQVELGAQERAAAIEMLIEVLQDSKGRTLTQQLQRGFGWSFGGVFPLCLIWSSMVASHGEEDWFGIFLQMMFVLGGIASLVTVPISLGQGQRRTSQNDQLRVASAETLGRLGAKESIGVLALAINDRSEAVREAASSALHGLLPLLNQSDFGNLNERDMRAL